jgi:hypothetical protein
MELESIEKINKKMDELKYEKQKLKSENVDCIDIGIIESQLLELEQMLYLETTRQNDLLRLKEYQNSCSHVYVDDLIDITPDKSLSVKYCVHCLFTICQE